MPWSAARAALLHLKIANALLDFEPPQVLVLGTGDGGVSGRTIDQSPRDWSNSSIVFLLIQRFIPQRRGSRLPPSLTLGSSRSFTTVLDPRSKTIGRYEMNIYLFRHATKATPAFCSSVFPAPARQRSYVNLSARIQTATGFPSTSVNRTTTCETEVVTGREDYSAAITFISEEEADFEVRQSLSGAVLRAVDATTDADIAKVFLERSDMRFRLKYLLSDWPREEVEIDPYEIQDDDTGQVQEDQVDASPLMVSPAETEALATKLRVYVEAICEITAAARKEVEALQGPLDASTGHAPSFSTPSFRRRIRLRISLPAQALEAP